MASSLPSYGGAGLCDRIGVRERDGFSGSSMRVSMARARRRGYLQQVLDSKSPVSGLVSDRELAGIRGENDESQSKAAVGDEKTEVVSPFSKQQPSASSGLYSAETLEFTVENVDTVLNEVRPYLIADGGNVTVVSIDDGTVALQLEGACGSCPSSTSTMKMGIERVLREKFGDAIKDVVDVNRPATALAFETVDKQIDELRAAVVGYGGSVELASVDAVKNECHVKYKGPVPLGLGIKAIIRDKFPDINIVLTEP